MGKLGSGGGGGRRKGRGGGRTCVSGDVRARARWPQPAWESRVCARVRVRARVCARAGCVGVCVGGGVGVCASARVHCG